MQFPYALVTNMESKGKNQRTGQFGCTFCAATS